MNKFKSLIKGAHKDNESLQSKCSTMAEMLQPYFPEDISVFIQPSDGLVVLHGDMTNSPICDVLYNIDTNPNYYL